MNKLEVDLGNNMKLVAQTTGSFLFKDVIVSIQKDGKWVQDLVDIDREFDHTGDLGCTTVRVIEDREVKQDFLIYDDDNKGV